MTTRPMTREEVVAAATSYVRALVSHDADSVRLAEGVRRIGNGRDILEGADALREVIRREPVGAIGELRWVVDGNRAAVLYDLDADPSRRGSNDRFGPREEWIPAYVAEQFTVDDGLITEIEVVYAASAKDRPRPPREARYPRTTGAEAPLRDAVVGAASAYLAALVSHDGRDVPLAPQAWRVENGANSGDTGPDIATALGADVMHVVTAVRDEQWSVEDDTAIVFYTIDVDPSRFPGSPPGAPTSALRLGERFRVWDGMIAEIEAVIPALPVLAS